MSHGEAHGRLPESRPPHSSPAPLLRVNDTAFPARSDVATAWRDAYEVGRRAHRGLDVPLSGFLSRCLGQPPPHAAADYYLARACDLGVAGAFEALERAMSRPIATFLRRRGASQDDATAIVDEAWGTFAAPPPMGDARTAIGMYDGRGSLHAWVATIAWRRLCDRWRARAAAPLRGPDPDTLASDDDPAARLVDAETARTLGDALESAWPRLTSKELEAVVLKYRHGLPQTAIASALRVGTPRVTRLLQSAARRLRDAVHARLGASATNSIDGDAWSGVAACVERILSRSDADGPRHDVRRSIDG